MHEIEGRIFTQKLKKAHGKMERMLLTFVFSSSLLHIQEVKASIEQLRGPVEGALARREEMVSAARPLEAQRTQETATLLSTNWDKLNKLHQDRLK